MVAYLLACVAVLCGIVATVLFEVLMMASSPNSSPAQLAQIKAWMWAMAGVWLVSAAGAGWLMFASRPWLAAGVGAAPVVFAILAVVILMQMQA